MLYYDGAVPGADPYRARSQRAVYGSGKGCSEGVPRDQELRQQQFIRDHPAWSIHPEDGASRFTAEKDDGTDPGRGMPLVQAWARRLAAGGFGVRSSRWRDRYELIILDVPGGRSSLTVTGDGYARWFYEPRASPASPAALAGIIVQILGAPRTAGSVPVAAAYRAFPLKGAVGRCLQDRGLTVVLRVCGRGGSCPVCRSRGTGQRRGCR